LVTKKKRSIPKERISSREILSDARNIYRKKIHESKPEMAAAAMANFGAPHPPEGDYVQNLNITAVCKDCNEYPPNLVEEF
jgi:hypothetical protein